MPPLRIRKVTSVAGMSLAVGWEDSGLSDEKTLPLPRGMMGWAGLAAFAAELSAVVGSLSLRWGLSNGVEPSCRKGCGACCRQVVPISPPEAFRIAEIIESLPDSEKTGAENRFKENHLALLAAGFGEGSLLARAGEYFRLGLACPFLVEESCSIHAQRPLVCREHLVLSAPEHCAEFPSPFIRMFPMGKVFCQTLAEVYAELTGGAPEMIPLVNAPEWLQGRKEEAARRWDAPLLIDRLLQAIT